jgi:hypothetical protein
MGFLFGIYDIFRFKYSHLTLWAWIFHMAVYSLNSRAHPDLYIMSYVGSYVILTCYLNLLFFNKKVDFVLIRNVKPIYIILRSIILHCLIPIISIYYVKNIVSTEIKPYLFYYAFPLTHSIFGIIDKRFSAYDIYITNNSISKLKFIIVNFIIITLTIFLCYYIKQSFLF